MGWLEKIDFTAFSEDVLGTLSLNLAFSGNIDLLMERNNIQRANYLDRAWLIS